MDITPSNLSALFIGFDQRLQEALQKAPKVYDKVASTIPCSTSTLALPFLQLFPQMREWLGERVINNYVLQDIQITPKKFELTAGIERSKIEDDQYGVFLSLSPGRIAREVSLKPDSELASLIESASGASATGFDGVAFFSTAHPLDPTNSGSGTQSNWYDSTHTGAAALDLTPANVAIVRAAMMSQKGPDGQPLAVMPNVIMVPPALELKARQAANSQFYPTSIGGSAGPVSNVFAGAYEVVVNPFLTDSLAWYLLDTTQGIMPFIWVERTAPEYSTITDPANPLVFMNDQYFIGVRRRGAAAMGLYYLCFKARNA